MRYFKMTRMIERQTDLLKLLMKDKSPKSIPGLKELALNWGFDTKTREGVLHKIAEIGGNEAIAALNSVSHKSDDLRIKNKARDLSESLRRNKKESGFTGVLPMAEEPAW